MIAEELLRISLDPRSGRLRHRNALAIATRAALMAELALQDCLIDAGPYPKITPQQPPDDRILRILRDAIDRQPGHRWVRWFTHVSADREAVARALVEQGRWEVAENPLFGGTRYRDVDAATAVDLVAGTLEVSEFRRAPRSPEEAVRAALSVICGSISGRPQPRRMDTELLGLLDTIEHPRRRQAVQAALDSAAAAVRRRRSR